MGEVTTRGQVPFWLRASQMSSLPSLLRVAMLPATPLPLSPRWQWDREEPQTYVALPLTKQRLQQPTPTLLHPHSQSSYMTCCNRLYTLSPSLISCYTDSIVCGEFGGWYALTGPPEAFISCGDPTHSESVLSDLQGICFLVYWQL